MCSARNVSEVRGAAEIICSDTSSLARNKVAKVSLGKEMIYLLEQNVSSYY